MRHFFTISLLSITAITAHARDNSFQYGLRVNYQQPLGTLALPTMNAYQPSSTVMENTNAFIELSLRQGFFNRIQVEAGLKRSLYTEGYERQYENEASHTTTIHNKMFRIYEVPVSINYYPFDINEWFDFYVGAGWYSSINLEHRRIRVVSENNSEISTDRKFYATPDYSNFKLKAGIQFTTGPNTAINLEVYMNRGVQSKQTFLGFASGLYGLFGHKKKTTGEEEM